MTAIANNRRDDRTNVITKATCSSVAGVAEVRVRNLSASGMQLEVSNPPAPGTEVTISKGNLKAHGTIAWVGPRRCGIRLQGTIDLDEWLHRRASRIEEESKLNSEIQRKKAQIATSFKAEVSDNLTLDSHLRLRCSEEMLYISRLVENLGETFMKEPVILARHIQSVQEFDVIKQLVVNLARVIAAENILDAAIDIPLTSQRSRLLRTKLGHNG